MSSEKIKTYSHDIIEKKWQKHWEDQKIFKVIEDTKKPKFYVLDMFPYPSGNGLHVGHPEGYTATDIYSRFLRMKGYNVLHPMGWDAFGLPAEQHALKTGTHPKQTTKKNIKKFKSQIKSLGLSYDWDREINTTDPKYIKWTQWIFLQLLEKKLAYQSFEPVNWCPELGTVLANEEVIDGKSEVGGFPVEKKQMRQWVLKITEYADRLLDDLEDLDWPNAIKEQQKYWIGKSLGADVFFKLNDHDHSIPVFTTRPDTLFGATFLVLSPEHEWALKVSDDHNKTDVQNYIKNAENKSDRDRISSKEKTGVFTGGYAINPVNNAKIPIYIADYVLVSYGHGAIMAVPAHDERDYEFAKKYEIPIKPVVQNDKHDFEKYAYAGDGKLFNSDFLNGLTKGKAIKKMIVWLEENSYGKKTISYKLRDWLFSRQRYWGEPIPVIHSKDGKVVPLNKNDLPVVLPEVSDFKPSGSGESPLAKSTEWLKVTKDGESYLRETNTMPQWAGSCWYYLRYIDPHNELEPFSKEKEKYWMNVDLYVGGAEHAVLHLLYARFWHKVLYDLGYVSTKEPFQKLVNQGMILGSDGQKMSKSRGNVVNPDDVVTEWGADSLRLYEMFMGPLEATKPWQTNGITGCNRFLKRTWSLIINEDGDLQSKILKDSNCDNFNSLFNKTIKKVTEDIEHLRFNTAISALMEFVNQCYKEEHIGKKVIKDFIILVSPFAPHIAEELWEKVTQSNQSISYVEWPEFEEHKIIEDLTVLSLQVNGKPRDTLSIENNWTKESILNQAKSKPNISKHIEGKNIIREIYVPNKIVNFVIK